VKYSLAAYIEHVVNNELKSLSESFRGFSFKLLKQKTDLKEIQKYAEDHLPRLGSGGARTVFGLGSGKILKVANHTSVGFSDLTRYDHWGTTTDGRLVLADYGINNSLSKEEGDYNSWSSSRGFH